MKKMEEKLGIAPSETKKPKKCSNDMNIDFNEEHVDDMKDDYKDIRSTIKATMNQAKIMLAKIIQSVETQDESELTDDDRLLARKAEAFAKISKSLSELNNDLITCHQKFVDVFYEEDNDDDDDDEENKKVKLNKNNSLFED